MTIDWWTLGIQTVNVVILVWLLGHFFWRPVAAMIEQRRAATRKRSGRSGGRSAVRRAPPSPRSNARAPALRANASRSSPPPGKPPTARAKRGLGEADKGGGGAAQTRRRRRSPRSRQAADKAWADGAERLAIDIAQGWWAASTVRPSARLFSTGWWRKSERCRRRRACAAAGGATLEAISAAPLEKTEQERAPEAIAQALGVDADDRLQCRTKALIAGLELRRTPPRREEYLARRSRFNSRGPRT